jgi:hypothetical protein
VYESFLKHQPGEAGANPKERMPLPIRVRPLIRIFKAWQSLVKMGPIPESPEALPWLRVCPIRGTIVV